MKRITRLFVVMFALTLCFTLAAPVTAKAATIKKPAKVTSVQKSAVTSSSIGITYKQAARAKGYQVQYSTKSNMKSAKTVKSTKTSATIKSLKANTTYYIRVRAYNTSSKKKTQYGAWSSKIKIKTEVAKPAQVKSLKKSSAKQTSLTVTYAKAAGAKGYQVQYAVNSKMTSAKTVKSARTSATLTGLNAGTTYYIQVRAYNTLNSKKTQYGSWSKTITVKTAGASHTHTWTTKTVVDKEAYDETTKTILDWYEFQRVYVGVKDRATGTIYPDYWAFEAAFKARCNRKPYNNDFLYIYEIKQTHYAPGTEPSDAGIHVDWYRDGATGKCYENPWEWVAASKEYMRQVAQYLIDGTEITAEPTAQNYGDITWRTWARVESIGKVHHDAVTHTETVCSTCGAKK